MSLIIIGKMGIAGAGIAVASVGGIALTRWLAPSIVEIYGFLDIEGQKDSIGSKKFECKIPEFDAFECSVKEVEKLDSSISTKNHVLLEKLTSTKDVDLAKEKLDKTKFYKISISKTDFESPKPTKSWKSIEVFEKEDSNTTKIGTINVLSVIKNGSPIMPELTLGKWETTHFVGQSLGDVPDIVGYKCSWDSNATEGKDCTINPFVKDDAADGQNTGTKIESLTFDKGATLNEGKKIIKHHYYLIKLHKDDAKCEQELTSEKIVYLKDGTSDKTTFTKISAVQPVWDQLLIFKKHQEA